MLKQMLVEESKYEIKSPYIMTPRGLCIHNTYNDASAKNEASYMVNNDNEVSFHIVVDDFEEIQVIPFDRNAWAAGDGQGPGNRSYIHLEICYSKSGGERFKKAEERAIKVAANICRLYGWNINSIKAHRDFSNKDCPHRTNMDLFKKFVQNDLNGILGGSNSTAVVAPISEKKYVHLKSHMTSWAVYPISVVPVKSNACGYLNPSVYGGLDYEILANPQLDVYTIETQSFGKVNIYIPKDDDSKFYIKEENKPQVALSSNKKYLNLHPHVSSWRVYPLNKELVIGNEIGKLAPAQFSGLSYEIIGDNGDVKIIKTDDFGTVNIYAPRDNDSSITTAPIY